LAFPSLIVFKAFKSVGEDSPLFRKIDFCWKQYSTHSDENYKN
jgi:hypothetical protein